MARLSKLVPDGARAVISGNAVLGYVVGENKPTERERRARRFSLAGLRLTEMEMVLNHLFGGPVDTDDAEHLAAPFASAVAWRIAAEQATATPTLTRQVAEYLRRWFPTLSAAQRGALAFRAATVRQSMSADEVAIALSVTFAIRQELGLRTIGASDVPARERKRIVRKGKLQRKRHSQQGKRRAAGMIPREEYLAKSVAELARTSGVSRKTIYAWKAQGNLTAKLAERKGDRCVPGRDMEHTSGHAPVTLSAVQGDGRPSGAAVTPPPDLAALIARMVDQLTGRTRTAQNTIATVTSPLRHDGAAAKAAPVAPPNVTAHARNRRAKA